MLFLMLSLSPITLVIEKHGLCSSVHSSVEGLCQASYGPDNYTLSWEVRNTSSVSMFRVYHEGVLQGTTLITNYTVGGLLPCREYRARVEALCGDSVVMSAKTVTAHTGDAESGGTELLLIWISLLCEDMVLLSVLKMMNLLLCLCGICGITQLF